MLRELSYVSYACDDDHMEEYREYQQRYKRGIRESDKIIIETIRGLAGDDGRGGECRTLLDIGCSTGNLLFHLQHLVPGLELHGGDMAAGIIAHCQNDPDLAGIEFTEMDMLNLDHEQQFDIVVANASLMFFSEEEFDRAIQNIAAMTKAGGWFVAFDYFHPFEQEVSIVETSKAHPHGLKFALRSYATVQTSLEAWQFGDPTFTPFAIPIDIERPHDRTDITTYTVRSDDEARMSFRGSVYQPWCHLVVQKRVDE